MKRFENLKGFDCLKGLEVQGQISENLKFQIYRQVEEFKDTGYQLFP
jgi:hypothetical protein